MASFALSCVGFAHAQESTVEETTQSETAVAPAAQGEKITVVGSRIRRDEYTSTSPIQVITKDESTLSGLSSTTEILQGTSVTGGSGQINNYFGGYVVDGGPGANTLSLRGLGASRTLILLNGRRLAPAGTRGAVGSADLNVLPNAIVDRIEILKDGASSIYGSDAVAGVVNIITERGIDGWTLEGQANQTEHGGGNQYNASIVGGYTGDRFDVSGSLEYYERTSLKLADRSWTQCNTDGFRDPDTGESLDFIDPLTNMPKCYPITGTGSNGVTINTVGTAPVYYDEGLFLAPGTLPLCDFVTVDANCAYYGNRWRPNAAAGGAGLPGFEAVGGANIDPTGAFLTGMDLNIRDTFDPRMLQQDMVSPAQVYKAFLQGSYDTGALGNAEAYFEILAQRRQSQQTGYRQLSLDYPAGSPLIPDNIAAIPGNIFGTVKARAFIGWGNYKSEQEAEFYKLTAGLTGDFAIPDWRYDVTATTGKSDAQYVFESFLEDRVVASLDVVPTADGFACAALATMPGCVAAPLLNSQTIAGQLPAAYRDYIFRPVIGNTTYEETTVTATIDGPLFNLPAGEVQGVFGVEYRTAEIDDSPGEDSVNDNLYNFTSSQPTRGDDSVQEAFAEVEVPILSNLPGVYNLTANVSGRYTDYESYGDDTTYKVGLAYQPLDWITLRASHGTSYRAPALFEQFQGGTSGFLSSTGDPCNNYGSLPTSSIRYQNCDAELGNPSFIATSGIAVITQGGGSFLRAETSDNTTIGLVFQPQFPESFGDLSFAVDYYDIEVSDEVEQIGASGLLSLCYNDPQFRSGGGYCNYINARDPLSNQLTVINGYTNIATQIVEGYDYNARYVRDIGQGTLRVNAELTQYLQQSSKLFPDDPFDDYNGLVNSPEYAASLDASFQRKEWRFFYGGTWTSAADSNAFYEVDPTVDPYDFSVPDYFLHNISVRYTSANDWEFTAGIRNLTDKEPPTIPSLVYNKVGNAPLYSGYDYFGRQVFLNIAKTF